MRLSALILFSNFFTVEGSVAETLKKAQGKKTNAVVPVKKAVKKWPASVPQMTFKMKRAKPLKATHFAKKLKPHEPLIRQALVLPAKKIVNIPPPLPQVTAVLAPQPTLNADVFRKNAPAVVKVVVAYDAHSSAFSEGSGFFVSPYVVATHIRNVSALFSGETHRQILIYTQNKYYRAQILQLDTYAETVLLRPEVNSASFVERAEYTSKTGNPRRLVLGFTNAFLVQLKENEFQDLQIGGPVFSPEGFLLGLHGQSDYIQAQPSPNLAAMLDSVTKQPASVGSWKKQLQGQWNQIQSKRFQEIISASRALREADFQFGVLASNTTCDQKNLNSFVSCRNHLSPNIHSQFGAGEINYQVLQLKKTAAGTKTVQLEDQWRANSASDYYTAPECVKKNIKNIEVKKQFLFCNASFRFLPEFQKSLIVVQSEGGDQTKLLKVELSGFDAANTAEIAMKVAQDFKGDQ